MSNHNGSKIFLCHSGDWIEVEGNPKIAISLPPLHKVGGSK